MRVPSGKRREALRSRVSISVLNLQRFGFQFRLILTSQTLDASGWEPAISDQDVAGLDFRQFHSILLRISVVPPIILIGGHTHGGFFKDLFGQVFVHATFELRFRGTSLCESLYPYT